MADMITLRPIYLEQNQGLGNALKIALKNCRNELVARMDSDDISQPYRFEIQLEYMKVHPSVDMVGGNITEFIGEENNITGQRYVPESDEEIRNYMKKRCAFNHMSVMYRKSAVEKAGGYQDWFWNEDYYLWIRMMLSGAVFANVPLNIVNVRVGNEMSIRRGGMRYFRSEAALQKYMLEHKIISHARYIYNNAIRFIGEVVLPSPLRAKMFRFTRKKVDASEVEREYATNIQTGKMDGEPIKYPPFSVAMSVYGKDNPEWFDKAMESLMNQTVRPDEIVLVVDGPVPDTVQAVIDKYMAVSEQ